MTSVFMPSMNLGQVAVRLWLGSVFDHGFAFASPANRDVSAAASACDGIAELDVLEVRRVLDGDGSAFERIVHRYQQEIARRLCRFSRDPLVLEELVQETFVQAYFSLRRYRSDAPLIHWLHRIAVRVGYRYWKSRRSHPTHVPLDGQSLFAPSGDNDLGTLDRVLARLSARDRLVLTLMYLEEYSVQETATLTGWSRVMVKVQAYRARGRLRKLMQQELAGDRS